MLNQTLTDAFKFFRYKLSDHHFSAEHCLKRARAEIAKGKTPKHFETIGGMRGGADFKIGSSEVFWCERPQDHMRLVGYASECVRMDHDGWYLEDDGEIGETARGIVFQLPARNGKPQYVPGVADPFNDGPAIVCMYLRDDSKEDAARFADHLAEVYAERERDYRRAWNAGNRYAELGAQVIIDRAKLLETLPVRRALIRSGDTVPVIIETLTCAAQDVYQRIVEARKERAELESNFGRDAAFNETREG